MVTIIQYMHLFCYMILCRNKWRHKESEMCRKIFPAHPVLIDHSDHKVFERETCIARDANNQLQPNAPCAGTRYLIHLLQSGNLQIFLLFFFLMNDAPQ